MPLTSRRRTPVAVGIAAALLLGGLAGCGSSSETEDDFDAWIADHPVPGAELTSRRATDSIFGRNEIFADYRLTATPGQRTIRAAMKGACGFNAHTKAMPRYTLVVGPMTFEVACRPENQAKVAAFWDTVHDLPFTSLDFTQGGVTVRADSGVEAFRADVLARVIEAAQRDDLVRGGQYSLAATGLEVTVSANGDLDAVLAATRRLVLTTAGAVGPIRVTAEAAVADSDATVTQAREWEDEVNGEGPPLVVVGSSSIRWNGLPPSRAARDLVDRIAGRDGVRTVVAGAGDWSVVTSGRAAMQALLPGLARDAAATDLGDLTVEVDRSDQQRRQCALPLGGPDDLPAAQVLVDVCAVPDVDVGPLRAGETDRVEVQLPTAALDQVLGLVRRLPEGTTIQLTESDGDYAAATVEVGDPVRVVPLNDRSKAFAKRVEQGLP